MSNPYVRVAGCSYKRLVALAKRCGFIIVEGGKHSKVKRQSGEFVTIIPRHNRLKRETVRGIIKRFNEFGGEINLL